MELLDAQPRPHIDWPITRWGFDALNDAAEDLLARSSAYLILRCTKDNRHVGSYRTVEDLADAIADIAAERADNPGRYRVIIRDPTNTQVWASSAMLGRVPPKKKRRRETAPETIDEAATDEAASDEPADAALDRETNPESATDPDPDSDIFDMGKTTAPPPAPNAPAIDAAAIRDAFAPLISQLADTVRTTATATAELSRAMETAIDQQQRQIADLAQKIESGKATAHAGGHGLHTGNTFDDLKHRLAELQALKELLGSGTDTDKLLADLRRMQEEFKRGFEEGRDRGKLEAQVEYAKESQGVWGVLNRIAEKVPDTAIQQIAMAPTRAVTTAPAAGSGNALKDKRQQLKQTMIQRKQQNAATQVFLEVCGLVEHLAANMHSEMGPDDYAAWAQQQMSAATLKFLRETPWSELVSVLDEAIKAKLSPAGLAALPGDIREALPDFFDEFKAALQ